MSEPQLDYSAMIDKAMRGVVKESLIFVSKHGLSGEHHFYISFLVNAPGVRLSEALRHRFPQEMTIVLQHQFWDLSIQDHQFSVMLSFNNIPERITIPYDALTAFADPSIKFGLQFHARPAASEFPDDGEHASANSDDESPLPEESKVITLDAFRKK